MVFLPQEVIAHKRDGNKLSREEIRRFISGFAAGTVSDAQAAAFAMAVYFRDMDLEERVALTEAMRDSGSVLDWSDLDGPVVDKHSTGGIGDNTSLMLAPILAANGVFVPMISGRGLGHTGGTLDKFDSIPGYSTKPDNELFRKTVREVGCAIIGQTDDLAPADRTLYAIRDVTATVENISLITASILSKKLAAGLQALILDVKTGSGAFMKTREQARDLADSLVSVANGAGVKTGALITDMNEPLASAAGNALEIRNAVDFLTGAHRDPRLLEVVLELCAAALVLGGVAATADEARARCKAVLTTGAAVERFSAMVHALGGPPDFVGGMDKHLETAPIVRDVFAKGSGVISAINARGIGMAVVALGGGRRTPSDKIDYAVGFDRLSGIGVRVDGRTPLARLHARDETSAAEAAQRLIEAYQIGGKAPDNPLIAETLMPGEARLMPRVIIALMDSFGIGGAPDAASYFNDGRPDTGADTFLHIAEACAAGQGDRDGLRAGPLHLPTLDKLGLGAAGRLSSGVLAPGFSAAAAGFWAVGREVSKGKDTPSGHWEIAGVPVPFEWGYFPPTEPSFPADLVARIVAEAGLPGILGNRHASGTTIIAELGEEHIRTGKPICYTSADSVFQIAAHETHFGLKKLYDLCEITFRLIAPLMIGRVIARPFVGETPDTFKRTGNRHDYAIPPPEPTLLDRVSVAGFDVYALGKISDIYAGRGVTHRIKATGNMVLMDRTLEALDMAGDRGLIFTNFVDFDQEFGHRRDVPGYANALEQFDARLPELVAKMRDDDLLILTADHGNDPTWTGTDHTREQVPILMFSPALKPGSGGLRTSLADIGETAARWLGIGPGNHGRSFL